MPTAIPRGHLLSLAATPHGHLLRPTQLHLLRPTPTPAGHLFKPDFSPTTVNEKHYYAVHCTCSTALPELLFGALLLVISLYVCARVCAYVLWPGALPDSLLWPDYTLRKSRSKSRAI
jgi:hypothetical protein